MYIYFTGLWNQSSCTQQTYIFIIRQFYLQSPNRLLIREAIHAFIHLIGKEIERTGYISTHDDHLRIVSKQYHIHQVTDVSTYLIPLLQRFGIPL